MYGFLVRCCHFSPAQDDDEREAHAAFLVESEGLGVLDCGATTSFWGVLKVQRLCFPRVMNMIHKFPDVDPFGGRSFNFGDGASCKATSLSNLPVRNDASWRLLDPCASVL